MRDRDFRETSDRLERDKMPKAVKVNAAPTIADGQDGDWLDDGTFVYLKSDGVWIRFDNITRITT